ncbi:MAG TPA: fibronectin type III domain-containing protein [Reyranella sp.]
MSMCEVGNTRSHTAWVAVLVCLWLGPLVAGNAGAQAPPAAPAPPAATPLPADLCKTAQAKSPATDITVTLDPATSWQPRGGEVRVVIESKTQPLKDVDALVCFRWSVNAKAPDKAADYLGPSAVRVVEFSSNTAPAKAVFSVTVPNLEPVKSSWFDRLRGKPAEAADQPERFDNGMMVPVADMKVVLVRSNVVVTTAVLDVGVTSVWTACLTTLVCILGAHALLYSWAKYQNVPGRSPWMRLISTREGYASLSQMQIMLWSFVFGAGAVYVMSLSGSLINIPISALVLLGIAGATTVGARIQGANAASAQAAAPSASDLPTAAAAPAAPQNVRVLASTDQSITLAWDASAASAVPAVHAVSYARQDFADWQEGGDRIKQTSHRVARLLPNTTYVFQVVARNDKGESPPAQVTEKTKAAAAIPRKPRWSDLVVTPQHPGEIDVTRVQMLFFTLITAAFVAIRLINSYMIPEIPDGFMLLMGISNGVYLSAKFVPD